MSDLAESVAPTGSSPAPNPLRPMREKAGIQLTALAAMLKVPPQKLEALEAGRYDDLPNLTFARALATSVCRVLKVDPVPVLSNLPMAQSVHIRQLDEGLNTPFPIDGASTALAGVNAVLPLLKRPIFWMTVVLALAGSMWVWLPENLSRFVDQAETVTAVSAESPSLGLGVEPVLAPAPEVTAAPEAVATSAPEPEPDVSVAEPEPPLQLAVTQSQQPPAEQAQGAVLTVRVHAPSWVQVTGASGRLLLQRTLQPAEEVSFGTDMPLSVVLGRADVAEVHVRGAVFDLTPYVRNRVARFEVK